MARERKQKTRRSLRIKLGFIAAGMIAALLILFAAAAISGAAPNHIVVDTKEDIAGDCNVPNKCSLRAAVNKSQNGDTVEIPALPDGEVYEISLGEIVIQKSITLVGSSGQQDADASKTIIQVKTGTSSRAFQVNPLGEPNSDTGYNVNFQALTIRGGTATDTDGSGFGGGAIGGDTGESKVTLYNCRFENNAAAGGGFGGGVYFSGLKKGKLIVEKSTFRNNTADRRGGGLYVEGDLDVDIINTIMDRNKVLDGIGGGFSFVPASTDPGQANIQNSTFSRNQANGGTYSKGGGMSVEAPVTLNNTTISDNSADGQGAGIWLSYFAGSSTLQHLTISGNAGKGDGAGFFVNAGRPTLSNSIVAGNVKNGTANDFGAQPQAVLTAASGFNLIGKDLSGTLLDGSNGNIVGIADPGLGPLADHGGYTETRLLLSGSKAIDAGDNAAVMEFDQRGLSRKLNGKTDIGAVEKIPDISASAISTIQFQTAMEYGLLTFASSNPEVVKAEKIKHDFAGLSHTLTITPEIGKSGTTDITITAQSTIPGKAASELDVIRYKVISAPDLTARVTHTDPFFVGQDGAAYSIVVENIGNMPTSGAISVKDTLPAGLTATSIQGTGWSCTLSTLTCTRGDVLQPQASFQPITLTVNVGDNAASTVTNIVEVTGDGDGNPTNNRIQDVTNISSLPVIRIETNGQEAWSSAAATRIRVEGSGFNEDSLKFVWSMQTDRPDQGWSRFNNNEEVKKLDGDGDWYLHVQATDTKGRTAYAVSNRFRLSNSPPAMTIQMKTADGKLYGGGSLTNQNVIVASSAVQADVGIKSYKYQIGSGALMNYTDGQTVTISDDGITLVTFVAADNLDRETKQSVSIHISKNAPILKLTPDITSPTNRDVTVHVEAEASGAGNGISVTKYVYGMQNAAFFRTGGTELAGVNEFTVHDSGTYTVYTRDLAGNETVKPVGIFNIMRQAPALVLTQNPNELTNGSVKVSVTAGVYGMGNSIAVLKSAVGQQDETYFEHNGGSDIDLVNPIFTVSQNDTYTVFAKDLAGNTTVQTIHIENIETSTPSIQLSMTPGTPTRNDVVIHVDAQANGSGSNRIIMVKWAPGNQDAAYFRGNGGTVIDSDRFEVSENDTYTVYVKDAAGNEKVQTIGVGHIYRDAPKLTWQVSPGGLTNQDVLVQWSALAQGSGNAIELVKWAKGRQTAVYFANGGGTLADRAFHISENSEYTLYAVDLAGNAAVEAFEVANIRKEPVDLNLTASPAKPTNSKVTIDVTAAAHGDANKIDVIKYAEGTLDKVYFQAGSGLDVSLTDSKFTVEKNGTYTVYVKDAAGNDALQTIDIQNIMNQKPTVSSKISPSGPTNGEVRIQVEGAAYGAGNKIAIMKYAPGKHDITYFKPDAGTDLDLSKPEFIAKGNGDFTVYAKDTVGNEAVQQISVANIYKNPPTLELSVNPSTAAREAVVRIAAAAQGDGNRIAELKYETGNKNIAYFSGGQGKPIASMPTGEFKVDANGAYTVYAKDAAGNEAVRSIVISNISKEGPPSEGRPGSSSSGGITATPTEPKQPTLTVNLTVADGRETALIISQDLVKGQYKVQFPNGTYSGQIALLPSVWTTMLKQQPNGTLVIDTGAQQLAISLSSMLKTEALLKAGQSAVITISVQSAEALQVEAIRNELLKQEMRILNDPIELGLFFKGPSGKIQPFTGVKAEIIASFIQASAWNKAHTNALYREDAKKPWSKLAAALTSKGSTYQAVYPYHGNGTYALAYTSQPDLPSFKDIQDHWAKASIERLLSKQIVQGTTAGTFQPNADVTRAQFISLLVRAFGGAQGSTKPTPFSDVKAASWYADEVAIGQQAGWIGGYGDGTFRPNHTISREEMAVMLARVIQQLYSSDTVSSTDSLRAFRDGSQISSWAKASVALLMSEKLINGDQAGNFNPKRTASRAEAVVLIDRIMSSFRR